jgi:UDP-glucose:(heptosyl)LPS alpha-1,3-glucosyltransferase
MKLAFALFKYFPYGGLQRDCIKIAQECVARGHEVDIFALEASGEVPEPLTVKCLDVKSRINYRRYEQFAVALRKEVENGGYDAVVGFNKMPGLDFYYAADPCYAAKVQERSWIYALLPRTRSFLKAEAEVFSSHSSTHVLLISPSEMKKFVRIYKTPVERMHLLPPGIQRDRIAPADYSERRTKARLDLGLSDDQNMLLMVGSGFKTKGVDRSLHAVASLPESLRAKTRLIIAGEDNPRAFLKLAHNLGISELVEFVGGREDIPDLLFAADFLLHPAYRENTGTVLLESVAAQLPVLCSGACGYAFYIKKAQCGHVLSTPFVQSEMNVTLASMLDSPESHIWKKRAARYVEENDLFSMPEKVVDVIEKKMEQVN